MKKVILAPDENLSFKITQAFLPQAFQQLDLYFSIPEDIGINARTLSEDNYFHSSINSQIAYFSEQVHLPLVRSRFVSQNKGEQTDYRSNINLFSYQFRTALETDIKQTIQLEDTADFYREALGLVEQTQNLLKKFRRYTPSDKKLSSYFENVDNYLSWQTEQDFLRLIAKAAKNSDFHEQRELLLDFCRAENNHRIDNQYNSNITLEDPNRITNKMRLLQRLSEFGVVFSIKTRNLDANLKRLVRGSVTAVIMAFVMSVILNARSAFTEVTLVLIVILGGIYGIREIFKDDLTLYIWRKIQQGRPKWQQLFINNLTQTKMAHQTIWLEYITKAGLPKRVADMLKKRRQQNKQASKLLHFRCDSRVMVKEFMPGFEEIQNQLTFNLTPFTRYLKKGEGRLFSLDGNKISNQSVERRYQLNLVLVQRNKSGHEYAQRFKVTMNRSKIINIEPMEEYQSF
ncbi:MAG: hypothetical protein ACSHW0_02385 [Thalassotalea sp.]